MAGDTTITVVGNLTADPELFFATDGERGDSKPHAVRVRAAKAVCNGCTVRAECLTYALTTRQRDGVWGGLTETERGALIATSNREDRERARRTAAAKNRAHQHATEVKEQS